MSTRHKQDYLHWSFTAYSYFIFHLYVWLFTISYTLSNFPLGWIKYLSHSSSCWEAVEGLCLCKVNMFASFSLGVCNYCVVVVICHVTSVLLFLLAQSPHAEAETFMLVLCWAVESVTVSSALTGYWCYRPICLAPGPLCCAGHFCINLTN